ncbi:MAG: DUF4157 domain-containing protein [bacterium]
MRLSDETVATLKDFVPERDLRNMRVVTWKPLCWLPAILKMSATTFSPFVIIRPGRYRTDIPRGMALIAHEAVHIGQMRELGWWRFYPRYLIGQFKCGFDHDKHEMEIPGIEVQRTTRRELESRGGGGSW